MISNKPVWYKCKNPIEGLFEARILFNSSTIRSPEMMLILSLFFEIASKDSDSISKFNCVAKRMARIIRNGSSEYVISGFKGVLMILFFKSSTPLKGSTKSPKFLEFKEKAKITIQEKYGVDHILKSKEIRDKITTTVQEKYGVDSVLKSPEVEEKITKTMIEKYGVKISIQNQEIKEKAQNTLKEKYGVSHPSQIDEVKQKKKETTYVS